MTYMKRGMTNRKATVPQSQPIPGQEARMAKNEAGGFTFVADAWAKFQRWLILGSEANAYYATSEQKTVEAVDSLKQCIREDGPRAVAMAVDASVRNRAIKNETCILTIGLALAHDDLATKRAAELAVLEVCRTGTHILHLTQYINSLGAWSRLKRRAVANWYTTAEARNLAFQVVKYQQRDGWTHRDVLRLTHAKPTTELASVFKWIMNGIEGDMTYPAIIGAFEGAKQVDKATVIKLINEYGLSREMLPTKYLSDRDVQTTLLAKMPIHALVRNLGNLTRYGVFDDMDVKRETCIKIMDKERIVKGRMHPIDVLKALLTYANGMGIRNSWSPVSSISDALDTAFYHAFGTLEPIGKNVLVAIDESGSMHGGTIGDTPGLTPAVAAAAYAMTVAKTDPYSDFVAFTDEMRHVHLVDIAARRRLDDVVEAFRGPGRGTDCASPIAWAHAHGKKYDAIVIITDNQTWAGSAQVQQVADQYKRVINPACKFITVAMETYGGHILDPERPENFTVTGFDAAAPELIRQFIQGAL